MKRIRTFLLFAFIGAGIINFLGVAYFKSSNISAFKKYIEFCAENEVTFNQMKQSSEMKDKVLQITATYRAFQEKGITNPDDMISYHTKNVRKGASVISNYYQLYKMGKAYELQVETGKKLIDQQ